MTISLNIGIYMNFYNKKILYAIFNIVFPSIIGLTILLFIMRMSLVYYNNIKYPYVIAIFVFVIFNFVYSFFERNNTRIIIVNSFVRALSYFFGFHVTGIIFSSYYLA
jgi:hypothetical protein